MKLPAEFLALAVILVFAGMLFFVIHAARRQQQARQNVAEALGFRPWPEIDPRFSESVRRLQIVSHPEHLEVRRAFLRRQPDMQLVLFDLTNTHDSDSQDKTNQMAVYLPGEDLPEFSLFPRFDEIGDGWLANLAEKAVKGLMEMGLTRAGQMQLDFFEQPVFNRRFIVSASDEQRVYAFLTQERAGQLCDLPPGVMLQVGGDLILIDRMNLDRQQRTPQDELRGLVDLARQAAYILTR